MSAFKRLLWFLLSPPQILAYARDEQDLKIHHLRWMTALAARPLVPVRVASGLVSASYWRLLLHALSFIPTHLPTQRTSSEPGYYGATLPHQFSRVEVRLVLSSPQHGVWWCKATRTDSTLTRRGYQERPQPRERALLQTLLGMANFLESASMRQSYARRAWACAYVTYSAHYLTHSPDRTRSRAPPSYQDTRHTKCDIRPNLGRAYCFDTPPRLSHLISLDPVRTVAHLCLLRVVLSQRERLRSLDTLARDFLWMLQRRVLAREHPNWLPLACAIRVSGKGYSEDANKRANPAAALLAPPRAVLNPLRKWNWGAHTRCRLDLGSVVLPGSAYGEPQTAIASVAGR
ncbi:hypothetical protein B0H14DRAFT_3466599 [Mycena olivaceomarginata]|nr:hypothetical protein B0H14DRAFT_3466599 [Mycena olivaceomarginata]